LHLNDERFRWEDIPTEVGPRWDSWREDHHLNNNPFWERYERQPLDRRRLWWWLIARWGMRALYMNVALILLFLIVVWAEPRVLKSDLSPLYLPWQLAACFIPLPYLWLWYRAIRDCGEEKRNPETWDVLMSTPIPLRQLFWARMTPILREALLLAIYLPGAFLFPLTVLILTLAVQHLAVTGWMGGASILLNAVFYYAAGMFYINNALVFAGAMGMISQSIPSGVMRTMFAQLSLPALTLAGLVLIFRLPDSTPEYVTVIAIPALFLTGAVLTRTGHWYVAWLDRRRDPYWRPRKRIRLKDVQ